MSIRPPAEAFEKVPTIIHADSAAAAKALAQEVKEIIEFAELVVAHKERVVITHRTYSNHILVLLSVIEHIKKEMLHMACQTNNFKSFERLCLLLEHYNLDGVKDDE